MKDAQTNIRLPLETKKKLEEKANKEGMSLSEYIRYLIFKDLEKK